MFQKHEKRRITLMKDLQFCDDWAEKLAARHPEDLSLSDRAALRQHLLGCPQCADVYANFNTIETRIQSLSTNPLPSLLSKVQKTRQNRVVDQTNILQSALARNSQIENIELIVEDAI